MLGFIVNPASGNGRGAKVWQEIQTILDQREISYEVRHTTHAGEALALAPAMIAERNVLTIVAVGGDGTVNEVVNGIYLSDKSSSVRFGLIPAGSGNDFARGYGIPSQPSAALDCILASEAVYDADLLQIGRRIAINSIGAGLDGKVAKVTNEARYKKWMNRLGFGMLAYVLSLVRVLCTYKPTEVWLSVDGNEYHMTNVWLIAVANIPYYGGGMMICPRAIPNDGLAEICVVSQIHRWQLLQVFPLVYKGKHVHHPAVHFYTGVKISIRSNFPLIVHTDGEISDDIHADKEAPLYIQVLPKSLQIIVPASCESMAFGIQ